MNGTFNVDAFTGYFIAGIFGFPALLAGCIVCVGFCDFLMRAKSPRMSPYRRCPGRSCNAIIEKVDGCDAMVCSRCNTRFEWSKARPVPMSVIQAPVAGARVTAFRSGGRSGGRSRPRSETPTPEPDVQSKSAAVAVMRHWLASAPQTSAWARGAEECPVCIDRSVTHRLVGCGHAVCVQCLARIARDRTDALKVVECPTCRAPVEHEPVPLPAPVPAAACERE